MFCPDSHTFLSAHLEHTSGIANTLYCGIHLGLLSSQGFSRMVIPVVFDLSVTSPTYMCSHTILLEVSVTTGAAALYILFKDKRLKVQEMDHERDVD